MGFNGDLLVIYMWFTVPSGYLTIHAFGAWKSAIDHPKNMASPFGRGIGAAGTAKLLGRPGRNSANSHEAGASCHVTINWLIIGEMLKINCLDWL
jgi:hypothetical protein